MELADQARELVGCQKMNLLELCYIYLNFIFSFCKITFFGVERISYLSAVFTKFLYLHLSLRLLLWPLVLLIKFMTSFEIIIGIYANIHTSMCKHNTLNSLSVALMCIWSSMFTKMHLYFLVFNALWLFAKHEVRLIWEIWKQLQSYGSSKDAGESGWRLRMVALSEQIASILSARQ